MYYFIYKTTNKINQKYYYGAHSTHNLNDGYLGSGTALKKAISKYGRENFYREIVEMCDNEEDMFHFAYRRPCRHSCRECVPIEVLPYGRP